MKRKTKLPIVEPGMFYDFADDCDGCMAFFSMYPEDWQEG